jgi:hypothetical protein
MAELTIRMISNPVTGKRDIYIEYESEEDALPHEHEKEHKDIIEQLLGKGILQPDDVGQVKVGRVRPGAAPQAQVEHGPEREAQATNQK